MQRKKIALFGSTGSIGTQTLEVARRFPRQIEILSLASFGNHLDLLQKQIEEFSPKLVVIFDSEKANQFKNRVSCKVLSGKEGLLQMASMQEVHFVLMAMSTTIGLEPTLRAIEEQKTIGIANKEILVAAGEWICQLAKENNVDLIPIDSEHSAIFQCLKGESIHDVRRLILTASGGPFQNHTSEQMQKISIEDALRHPSWEMGRKITIDSSTLMNKGLEVIEAHHLFQIPISQIEVVIHPESIVHSMVEFKDGSIKAQLSNPSMVLPIQYAIFYPERIENSQIRFDFSKTCTLHFEAPDLKRFPCLRLAFDALHHKKSAPCYLNAANEVLVHRFLHQEITWHEIGQKLSLLMEKYVPEELVDLRGVFDIECQAKQEAKLC